MERKLTYNDQPVTLSRGRFMPDPPKTWKRCGFIDGRAVTRYSNGLIYAYKAKDGSLRYEMYVDGSFYAMYGRATVSK